MIQGAVTALKEATERCMVLDELTHVVQRRNREGACDLGWHTMAAFDSGYVARQYADECRDNYPNRQEYRVVKIGV